MLEYWGYGKWAAVCCGMKSSGGEGGEGRGEL